MKVLLIWPKSRGDIYAIAEPLALEYLAGGLKVDSHEVRILDLRLHPYDLDTTLQEFNPDVVGVTAFSMHVRPALVILKRVKEILPTAHTIVGGHHASLLPEDFFEPQVDFVVSGEGVIPFRSILRNLERKLPALLIPGVWSASKHDGKFVSGGTQPAFNIDELPMPDRSLTAGDRNSYFLDWMKPIALVRTSVGCPYSCTFCSLWKIMEHRYHKRDIERVVEELSTIKEEFVFLVDDEAFIDGRRMLRLAEALKEAGIYKRYFTYCRIDTVLRNRDVLAAWREIGLERLFIGVDAVSKKDLHEFNKKLALEQIEAGLRTARELDIRVFAQFVVNTDYDHDDFQHLINFIQSHDIEYPTFTILTPIPGTELLKPDFSNVVELQPNGRPNWDMFDCQQIVVNTKLPRAEFMREYHNLYRTFMKSYATAKKHGESLLKERYVNSNQHQSFATRLMQELEEVTV